MAKTKKKIVKAKKSKIKTTKEETKIEVKSKKSKNPNVKPNPNPVEYNTWKEVSCSKHQFLNGDVALADTVEYIEVDGGRIYRNSLEIAGSLKCWLVFAPNQL